MKKVIFYSKNWIGLEGATGRVNNLIESILFKNPTRDKKIKTEFQNGENISK